MKKIIITILNLLFALTFIYANANEDLLDSANNSNIEKLKSALKDESDVNAKSNNSGTALRYAGHTEIVYLLRRAGAWE